VYSHAVNETSVFRTLAAFLLILNVGCRSTDRATLNTELSRADELIEAEQYVQAVELYERVVNDSPQNGMARMKLANAYQRIGKWLEASREAVRAAHLMPGNLDAQLLAARLVLLQAGFEQAASIMSRLLRDHPENVEALILWGNASARLFESNYALNKLTDKIERPDAFDAARRELRSGVTQETDRAAEAAFRKAFELAPDLPEARYSLVNFLWATGRPAEGETLLKRLADENPDYTALNHALGSYYLSRKQVSEAERYLKRAAATGTYGAAARLTLANYYEAAHRDRDALSLLTTIMIVDGTSSDLSLRMADIEFRLGSRDRAMRRLDALLAREPHNLRGVLLKARFLSAMGDAARALPFASAAAAGNATSAEARATLAEVLEATGDLEGAFDEYTQALRLDLDAARPALGATRVALALGRNKEAEQLARQAIRKNPGNKDAATALVNALVGLRDYSAAERELKPLLARYPDSPDVLVSLGRVRMARGEDDAALSAFMRALRSAPDSQDALASLVALKLKQRKVEAARQFAEAALRAHPQSPACLLLAARVYDEQNDLMRAESTLRQVLEVEGENIRASVALADVLMRQQRSAEARRLLDQLVERKPRSLEAQASLAKLLEQMGRITEARARYERILAQDPRAASAAHQLAKLHVDHDGNLDVALGLAIRAKQQLPNDPAVSDVLGWIYAKKNLPTLALPHLRDAVRVSPNNATYRYHLGSAYLTDGDQQKAQAELARALQIDQHFPDAARARAALASIQK
jgi:tetratricopeptide (TPR) repeat protein